jgi:predicted  nucleic acid-binding Zn-ribbon protein
VGVIGGLLIGAGALIAGPQRLSALWTQTTGSINDVIDRQISDPVAVRAQLRSLEAQYPKRIAAVRSDLAEVKSQLTALDREKTVTERVVGMAENDLTALTDLISKAEHASMMQLTSDAAPRRVEIVWNDASLSLTEAQRKAADVNNTREAYEGRLADISRDLGYMQKQHERLTALLSKLEREQADFQIQLWQLDRQVDSISRNDRMIAVLKSRQESIEEASRYQVGSLEGLRGKLADIRAKQEGELASLGASQERSDYETRAKLEIDRDHLKAPRQPEIKKTKDVIRITPESPKPTGGTAFIGPPQGGA